MARGSRENGSVAGETALSNVVLPALPQPELHCRDRRGAVLVAASALEASIRGRATVTLYRRIELQFSRRSDDLGWEAVGRTEPPELTVFSAVTTTGRLCAAIRSVMRRVMFARLLTLVSVVSASLFLALPAVAPSRGGAHGHYVKDILGQLQLECDAGYFASGGQCLALPSVAHGRYVKDILGQPQLECDDGYYASEGRCVGIPVVPHGRYVKDILGQPQLECDGRYYASGGRCVGIPAVAHGRYLKDILGRPQLECDDEYYASNGRCVSIPAVTHGRYEKNILGEPVLQCDDGYYANRNQCVPLPAVAHGRYEKDILGQPVLVAENAGFYVTGAACLTRPAVRHGHYEKDIFGEGVLVCDAGYADAYGVCQAAPDCPQRLLRQELHQSVGARL